MLNDEGLSPARKLWVVCALRHVYGAATQLLLRLKLLSKMFFRSVLECTTFDVEKVINANYVVDGSFWCVPHAFNKPVSSTNGICTLLIIIYLKRSFGNQTAKDIPLWWFESVEFLACMYHSIGNFFETKHSIEWKYSTTHTDNARAPKRNLCLITNAIRPVFLDTIPGQTA